MTADTPLICGARKMGEYDMLHCIAEKGHAGDHCYVITRLAAADTPLMPCPCCGELMDPRNHLTPPAGSAAPDALVAARRLLDEKHTVLHEYESDVATVATALIASVAREAKLRDALRLQKETVYRLNALNDRLADEVARLSHDTGRHVEIAADLATKEAKLREALRSALNMVDGNGAPPDWDLLRKLAGGSDGK